MIGLSEAEVHNVVKISSPASTTKKDLSKDVSIGKEPGFETEKIPDEGKAAMAGMEVTIPEKESLRWRSAVTLANSIQFCNMRRQNSD